MTQHLITVSPLYFIALCLCIIALTCSINPPLQWSADVRERVEKLFDLSSGAYSEKGTPGKPSGKDGCIAKHNGELFGSFPKINCDIYGNVCLVDIITIPSEMEIVIVFRGTTETSQLFAQGISFHWTPMTDFYGKTYGKVNAYYHSILFALWPAIEPVFILHPNFKVTFTGHSMGGSLAAMAAFLFAILCEEGTKAYYTKARKEDIQLHTFGAPRHGNPQHVQLHNKHVPYSVRYVNRDDGIAHYPKCSTKGKTEYCDPGNENVYVHEGVERWFDQGMAPGKLPKMCQGPTTKYLEDPNCSNTISVKWLDWTGFESSKVKWHVGNHRFYFQRWMSYYGIAGCDAKVYEKMRKAELALEAEEAIRAKEFEQLMFSGGMGLI